jgi:hypothetical protein
MPARLLLCLLFGSSWLTVEGGRGRHRHSAGIAGADGQPWPCRSAWPVAFHTSSPIADAAGFRSYLRAEAMTVAAASSPKRKPILASLSF